MSDKFFFKGRKTPKPKHESYGYNTKRVAKRGTESNPLNLIVNSEAREIEIKQRVFDSELVANIVIDVNAVEDIGALEQLLTKVKPVVSDKKPDRNQACPCGSGDKYKKCCGK
ncbi:PBPRA1643 family SWIM/SEC-C metal-binding motif protein [Shewanella surugensis]|uniref:SEC-C domain-containing protein n=1 Tax=Shewanella surugensis TaxID=212020 RepID=A0ABT0L7F2_9GAMM|nr:PBPRA1643 family SWIM/SEC-C metal-binding motif protein [Shewanella surugensis]MCL1123623.1 SEC-C domain-containing protein [Shewanella surugensis]